MFLGVGAGEILAAPSLIGNFSGEDFDNGGYVNKRSQATDLSL